MSGTASDTQKDIVTDLKWELGFQDDDVAGGVPVAVVPLAGIA